ncbi:hypothetical protein [Photobacterium sp. TY1-4]|uniref:hypothetical protein n=1 Tax=Photobacterium sp. TY1-4 TaxID=2899122 RepID=UPI0021C09957|nr:hypothetical protein [Photobacterium sp. TY1-4]UXI03122.1 hypothetical protein NH461_22035 [Photobacterium sp. TY1-4]
MFDFFTQLPIWFYVIAIVTNLPLILSDSPQKKNKFWPIITVINAVNFTVMIRLFQGEISPSFYVMIGFATLASALAVRFCNQCGAKNLRTAKAFVCIKCKRFND